MDGLTVARGFFCVKMYFYYFCIVEEKRFTV